MQLNVSFLDTDFDSFQFNATTESTVEEVLCEAAGEYNIISDILQFEFEGNVQQRNKKVFSIGVGPDSVVHVARREELVVQREDLWGKENKDRIDRLFKCNATMTCVLDANSMIREEGIIDRYHCFLPSSIRRVRFCNCENITRIEDYFLSSCTAITSIDLSSFINVTSIGNSFLSMASSLTDVDLSGFSNVTQIGWDFLRGCSSLQSLNITPLGNVRGISTGFLVDCSSLSNLNLESLRSLSRLENVDITDSHLPELRNYFFQKKQTIALGSSD